VNWRAVVGVVLLIILLWLCGPQNVAALIHNVLDWLRTFAASY
jgi:hypothetical protein